MQIIFDLINNSDFKILWDIGNQVLLGNSPYAVGGSWYPPGASYLFALFALLPLHISYVVWMIVNLGVFYTITRRFGARWFLFFPVVFIIFFAGQVDLIFVALIPFLTKKGWGGPIAAAFITLKPISAVVILPWFLIRWLLNNQKTFGRFIGATIFIQAWPMLVRPLVLIEWIGAVLGTGTDHYFGGFGIWLLPYISFPVLALVSLLVIYFGLVANNAHKSRIYLSLINPYAMIYHSVYLIGDVSILAILSANLGLLLKFISPSSPLPLILVPISFLFSDWFLKLEKKVAAISNSQRYFIADPPTEVNYP